MDHASASPSDRRPTGRSPAPFRTRSRSGVAALVALLASVGCSQPTTVEQAAVGDYRLTWVNLDELPAPLGEQEGFMVDILAGRIDVRADGTCTFSHTYELTDVGEADEARTVVDDTPCTWRLITDALHLRFPDGGSLSGFFSREAVFFDFLFPDGVFRFVYERIVSS